MDNIEKLYSEYAFINPSEAEGEGEAVTGAITNMLQVIKRSYEDHKWYFVVFKPFNRAYDKNPDWFAIKGLDHCRKMFKSPAAYILTREVNAEKIHINALVCTKENVCLRHDKSYCNKYKIHVNEMTSVCDRHRVLAYITKENTSRPYVNYLDYLISK